MVNKTVKNKKRRHGKFSRKITKYMCGLKEPDLCCESQYNRDKLIKHVFQLYDDDFESIDNDINIFIGFRMFLVRDKNKKGVKLWDDMSNKLKGKLTKNKIEKLLKELPLFYLLSFIGHAFYLKMN